MFFLLAKETRASARETHVRNRLYVTNLPEAPTEAALRTCFMRAGEVFGLRDKCAGFLSHCGSRGFGHALATGQFHDLQLKFAQWDIPLPGDDKELVYAPLGTSEADAYLDDMALGANFATVNHLLINALVLEAFQEVIPGVKGSLVYFISHNIARREIVNNQECWVHRKGATRAFGPGSPELPETFRQTGQPVICGGSMETGSYLLVGTDHAVRDTFGSTMHGSGRTMSRAQAKRTVRGEQLQQQMKKRGILVKAVSMSGLAEEAGLAYKNISEVVESVERAGII